MGTNRGEDFSLAARCPSLSSKIECELGADYSQLGLAAVPALPYMFDKPVAQAVEWSFHTVFKTIGGPEAVGQSPSTGREEQLAESLKKPKKIKEKEL